MIYKFLIGSEEAGNFKLEIAIDSSDTFVRLRNTILDAAGYVKNKLYLLTFIFNELVEGCVFHNPDVFV